MLSFIAARQDDSRRADEPGTPPAQRRSVSAGMGRTEIVAVDVAPEVHEAGGNREMSGVEHLYDFSHDFVARVQLCSSGNRA